MELGEGVKHILNGLHRKRRIGGKHTEERNVLRFLNTYPPELQKKVLSDWDYCIKEGFVLRVKKTGEWHVSLNPRKLKELKALVEGECYA